MFKHELIGFVVTSLERFPFLLRAAAYPQRIFYGGKTVQDWIVGILECCRQHRLLLAKCEDFSRPRDSKIQIQQWLTFTRYRKYSTYFLYCKTNSICLPLCICTLQREELGPSGFSSVKTRSVSSSNVQKSTSIGHFPADEFKSSSSRKLPPLPRYLLLDSVNSVN